MFQGLLFAVADWARVEGEGRERGDRGQRGEQGERWQGIPAAHRQRHCSEVGATCIQEHKISQQLCRPEETDGSGGDSKLGRPRTAAAGPASDGDGWVPGAPAAPGTCAALRLQRRCGGDRSSWPPAPSPAARLKPRAPAQPLPSPRPAPRTAGTPPVLGTGAACA